MALDRSVLRMTGGRIRRIGLNAAFVAIATAGVNPYWLQCYLLGLFVIGLGIGVGNSLDERSGGVCS